MAKVTIITASYNYSQYIGGAIESVINQTYKDWEMLVIDDGSKDNSVEIIKEYVKKDNRIKLLTHPDNENRGLVETLKLGLSEAKGEFVVFLESDDYIKEDYIEKKLEIFNKNNSVGLVYNNVQMIGLAPSKKYINWINRINNYWLKNNYPHNIHQLFALETYIPTFSCVMLKKDLLNNIKWDSPNPAWTDLWLWIQISKICDMYCLPEVLTFWRMHKDSYLNNAKKQPLKGYNFYKTLLFSNIFNIKRFDYKILFYWKKFIRLIYYKYYCLIRNSKSNTGN